jgi:hypothetical protein
VCVNQADPVRPKLEEKIASTKAGMVEAGDDSDCES